MISLEAWLNEKYMKEKSIGRSEAIISMASDLGASYSTVYKWLNDGDYFVSSGVIGTPWSDSERMVVFKATRFI
jgi:hypothetical protein